MSFSVTGDRPIQRIQAVSVLSVAINSPSLGWVSRRGHGAHRCKSRARHVLVSSNLRNL